mmetsp:Transcript_12681/g.42900  ORF Transcript_12681/g.42900 Transcript_12681/m.42900 type:complete len:336 (+) Transcript_12681:95-1102(+)
MDDSHALKGSKRSSEAGQRHLARKRSHASPEEPGAPGQRAAPPGDGGDTKRAGDGGPKGPEPLGSYRNYYSQRGEPQTDPRVHAMRADLFNGRRCADLGCNQGRVAIMLARRHNCHAMVGVDVDETLISQANMGLERLRRRMPQPASAPSGAPAAAQPSETATDAKQDGHQASDESSDFPVSVLTSMGLLPTAPWRDASPRFPHNVRFVQGDAVAVAEGWEEGSQDTVLCLSTTKWVHLNGGDEAIVRLFTQVHRSLSPGGAFILEPQPWHSYKRKKHVSEVARQHFREIQLRPERFPAFLVDIVGFRSCEELRVKFSDAVSKGYACRPLYVFIK